MEFGVFTSRGRAFENILKSDLFQVRVLPGAKLDQITRTLCDLIEDYDLIWRQLKHIHPTIAYVGAGIPDITTKLQSNGWMGRYQEVIMGTWEEEDYIRLEADYRYSDRLLRSKGVVPVFATIPPMDIKNWNLHRNARPINPRRRRATDYLMYESEYERMQHKQVEVITRMNHYIRSLNWENGVLDLDLAKFVMIPREGCRGREARYRINTGRGKLSDGCHASPSLARQWSTYAFQTVSNIRKSLSSPEALRIMDLPSTEYDLVGVPLSRSRLRLTYDFAVANRNSRH